MEGFPETWNDPIILCESGSGSGMVHSTIRWYDVHVSAIKSHADYRWSKSWYFNSAFIDT